MSTLKAVIIDDEFLAREIIMAYLKTHEDIEVLQQCEDGFQGIKAIQAHQPDLVFLDVQMPKLDGFEMLELLQEVPVVIFSTAYDEYAIKAFENNAIDYLLKPYDQARFDEAVAKARQRLSADHERPYLHQLMAATQEQRGDTLDRIVVKTGSKIDIIPVDGIEYIEAQDDYVALYIGDKKYLKQMTMKYLENHLPSKQFVRVHRSYIAAVRQIGRLELYSKESYQAILKNGAKLPVSRTGYAALKEVLEF